MTGGPCFALDSAGTIRALSLPAAPSLCISTARLSTLRAPMIGPDDVTAAVGAGLPEPPSSHEEPA